MCKLYPLIYLTKKIIVTSATFYTKNIDNQIAAEILRDLVNYYYAC